MTGRIILAGGSGFLGRVLARELLSRGQEVIVLSRSPRNGQDGVNEVAWDGKTLGNWAKELDRAAAVINFAGRSVNCRYHARNRREILESRINPTHILSKTITHYANPPHA